MQKPKTSSSQTVFENQWAKIKVDQLELGKARPYSYIYLEKTNPGAMVVPYFTDSNSVLMIKQYRHPLGKAIYGFPGGAIDQDFEESAYRELLEETGYQAEELIDLGEFSPDAGILSDVGRIYLALNPKKVGSPTATSAEETTKPEIFNLDQVRQMIRDGEIRDGWTLGPFSLFLLWLEERQNND